MAHFHPSVSVLASTLMRQDEQLERPDLLSHSLMRFLDKFAYRNPKATTNSRGTSIMQVVKPGANLDSGRLRSSNGNRDLNPSRQPINSAEFWNKRAADVAAEDVFFHEYFQKMGKQRDSKKSSGREVSAEASEEEEIWKALTSSEMPHDGSDVESDQMDLGSAEYSEEEFSDDISWTDEGGDSDIGEAAEILSDDDEPRTDENRVERATQSLAGSVLYQETRGSEMRGRASTGRTRRKALAELPTFASADDYAQLLEREADF
jgi:ribosome biogenesis protein MAK21